TSAGCWASGSRGSRSTARSRSRPSRSTRAARPPPMPTAWPSAATGGSWPSVAAGGAGGVCFPPTRTRPPRALPAPPAPIDPGLLKNDGRFRRVELGGRPTELALAGDDRTLYVANYLADAVQVVDAEDARLVRTIPLGGPKEPSLARRGEMIFHAAERSFN